MATICKHHVLTSMSGIPSRERDVSQLLLRAGINPLALEHDSARVHTDQVARLFQWVMRTLNDEFMGFAAAPSKLGTFALMSELIPNCLTLREQLRSSTKFYNLTHTAIQFTLEERQQSAYLAINLSENTYDTAHFLREFLLVLWHRFPSWLIGQPITLTAAEFSFDRPEHESELKVMFPCKIRFGCAENRLIFNASYLDKPITRTRAELGRYIERTPSDIMTIPGRAQTLESQIERQLSLRESEQNKVPTLIEIAKTLQISPQTLQRRLKQSGSSFNSIKENWRREHALQLLRSPQLSVEHISEKLGFAEARSFTRAFKTWTGLSPRSYRKIM
jgi:AraC-like DNA-binding protein